MYSKIKSNSVTSSIQDLLILYYKIMKNSNQASFIYCFGTNYFINYARLEFPIMFHQDKEIAKEFNDKKSR